MEYVGRYVGRYSTDTRPTLGRYLGRLSGKISTDTWSNVGRDVGRLSAECHPRSRSSMLVEYVGRVCQWSMSVEYVSGVCRSICRPILDRHSTDTWPVSRPILDRPLGRLSGKISTDTWSSVGRDVGRVCRSRCRPSVDRHTKYRPILATDGLPT